MPPLAIVENLDVVEERGAGLEACRPGGVVPAGVLRRTLHRLRHRQSALRRVRAAVRRRGYYAETPDQVGYARQGRARLRQAGGGRDPIDPDEFPTPVAAVRRDRAGARA